MTDTITVVDKGTTLSFSFEELMKYHGPGSPGGVAVAFKVLECALPLLAPDGPAVRREITIRTAFGGPGARDGLEYVTRALTGDRLVVDPELTREELGRTRRRFVFEIGYRDRTATLVLRAGYVTEEFIDLAGKKGRSAEEEAHLDVLKAELAERVMAGAAADVFDATLS